MEVAALLKSVKTIGFSRFAASGLAWGVQIILLLKANACGLGLTSDSGKYLSAAQSFMQGQGFLNPDGSLYRYWPPLYPVLIGLSPSVEALHLLALLLANIFFLNLLYLHKHTEYLVAALLLGFAPPLIMVASFVWSEVVFIALVLGLLCTSRSIQCYNSGHWWPLWSLLVCLLCLQRYAGIFVVVAVVLWLWLHKKPKARFRLLVWSGLALLLPGLWWLRNGFYTRSAQVLADQWFAISPFTCLENLCYTIGELLLPATYLPPLVAQSMGAAVLLLTAVQAIGLLYKPPVTEKTGYSSLIAMVIASAALGQVITGVNSPDESQRLFAPMYPLLLLLLLTWTDFAQKHFKLRPEYRIIALLIWLCYPALRCVRNVMFWQDVRCNSQMLRYGLQSSDNFCPDMLDKNGIARRIAKELKDGYYVNLGIGIPTLVANYIPQGVNVVLQSENGLLGIGPFPKDEDVDPDLINAGKQTITMINGSSLFSSADSFAMIRGGHVDLTILGAMEVSENGDIANWKIPGKMVKGMGGAMDLVASAQNIIVAMQHCSKDGQSKLLPQCSLPITGLRCVKKIVTDMAVLEVMPEGGFRLLERAPGVSVEQIKAATAGKLIIEGDIPEIAA